MANVKVIICDDHVSFAQGIAALFQHLHSDIEVLGIATDANEAINLVESARPEVVLMDIHFPRSNGLEATQTICHRWPEVKVVIFTGSEDDADVRSALSKGANGFLLKSMNSYQNLAASLRAVKAGRSWTLP